MPSHPSSALRRVALALLALALAGGAAGAQEPHPHAPGGHAEPHRDDRATVTHGFEDAERWAEVFDDPARDAWQKPAEVVRALALRPGDVVADLGAGTGYFNARWARAVGTEGAVFAVDVEPALVAHMRDRAEREDTPNVIPVLASPGNPRLPPGAVDVVVLVNAYHHIDRRRDYFRRLRRSLAPGGRLVVIDWRADGDAAVGPPPAHRIAAERVAAELGAAGYAAAGSLELLPYQYGRIFRPRPVEVPE